MTDHRPGMELGLGTLTVTVAISLGIWWIIYLAIRWAIT